MTNIAKVSVRDQAAVVIVTMIVAEVGLYAGIFIAKSCDPVLGIMIGIVAFSISITLFMRAYQLFKEELLSVGCSLRKPTAMHVVGLAFLLVALIQILQLQKL